MPDRHTVVVFAVLGLASAAIVAGALAFDLRHDDVGWPVPVSVTLGTGLAVGLLAALGARQVRRRGVLPVSGAAVGLLTGLAVYLWGRYGPFDDTAVVYHGRYVPIDGVTMAKAYSSTLTITGNAPVSWWTLLLTGAVAGLLVGLLVRAGVWAFDTVLR